MGSEQPGDPVPDHPDLFDLSPVASLLVSPGARKILLANQAFLLLVGRTAGDPLDKPSLHGLLDALEHVRELPANSSRITLSAAAGNTLSCTLKATMIPSSAGERTLLVTLDPVTGMDRTLSSPPLHEEVGTGGHNGEASLNMPVLKDAPVTEEPVERADTRPPDSSPPHRNNAIFENAPDGIFIVDPDTLTLLDANNVFRSLLGADPSRSFAGIPVRDFMVSSEMDLNLLPGLLDGYQGHSHPFRSRIKRTDGSIFTTSATVSLIPWGRRKALTVHIRDITQELLNEGMSRLWVDLDQRILLGDPLDHLISFIVRRVQDLFGFYWCSFTTPEPDGTFRLIEIASAHPGMAEKVRKFLFPLRWNTHPGNRTPAGRAITSGLPQFYEPSTPEPPDINEWLRENRVHAMIAIPISRQAGNRVIGVFTVAVLKKEHLSEPVQNHLKDLSNKIRTTFSRFEEQNLIRIQQASMESARSPMWIATPLGEIEWANNEFFRMIASERTSPGNLALGSLFPYPATTSAGGKTLLQLLRAGKPFEGEIGGLTVRGGRFITETAITPLKDNNGRIVHILGHQKDVTAEREEVEIDQLVALLDGQVLNGTSFQHLLDLLTAGVLTMTNAISVRIAMIEEPDNLVTRSVSSRDPSLSAAMKSPMTQDLSRAKGDDLSTLTLRKDRHQELSLDLTPEDYPFREILKEAGCTRIFTFPLREKGRPSGVLTLFLDRGHLIGNRSVILIGHLLLRLSIVLERFSELERMRLQDAAMANVSNGIIIASADGTIGWVNPAMTQISGYSEGELLGTKAWGTALAQTRLDIHEPLWKAISEGKPYEGILDTHRKDGSHVTVEISITPIQNREGRITHFVAIQKDQTLKIRQEREIWDLAHIDALTGLLNRASLIDRLKTETDRCRRNGKSLALLFIDLDGFKEVNDTFGHAAGDLLLKTIAGRLSRTLRSTDAAARLGGDEFILLITELSDIDEILSLIQRLFDVISETVMIEGQGVHITSSMGIATFPEDATDPDDLLRKADIAMYQAKRANKNNWQYFDPEMEKRIQRRHGQVSALIRALEEGELVLHYMPEVDRKRNAICAIEALIRWESPDHGLILPASFLPVAQDAGFMANIGIWTLQQTILTINRWISMGQRPLRIALNISSEHFWSPEFPSLLLSTLENRPEIIPWLTLEITESLLLRNLDEAIEFLRTIRELGVRVSVDDFGLGTSLSPGLSELPFDEIKIPQSYVLQMERHPLTKILVGTMIHLGNRLGIDVVGEGVSTEVEERELLSMGCHILQGFHIAKPMPLHELEEFLRNSH